jgi:hypothetical protein
MYFGLHVKYPLFFPDFNQLEFSWQIFEKYSNIKFHEQPSGGRRVVPRRGTDRWTDRQGDAKSCFSQFFSNTPNDRSVTAEPTKIFPYFSQFF